MKRYGVVGTLTVLFIWKWIPETNDRTLEEMEAVRQSDQ